MDLRTNTILKASTKDRPPAPLFVQKTEKQVMIDALKVSHAARQLERLPEPGEVYHVIMNGNYDGFDIVNGILRLHHPAVIERLDICTLGFNKRNTAELIGLMDSGQIKKLTFVCSVYFKAHEPETFNLLLAQLKDRHFPMIATRSHCKILLFEMSSGQFYAVESSANLRSCKMLEQFTLTHSRAVVEFHRGWLTDLIEKNEFAHEGEKCLRKSRTK
jgi:hypothetical protein